MYIKILALKLALLALVVGALYFLRYRKRWKNQPWFLPASILYGCALLLSAWSLLGITIGDGPFWPLPRAGVWLVPYNSVIAWYMLSYLAYVLSPLLVLPPIVWYIAKKYRKNSEAKKSSPDVSGRREFLQKAALTAGVLLDAAPAVGVTGIVSGMFLGSREIVVEKFSLKIPGLHPDLQGLRVMQISDLHMGLNIDQTFLETTLDIIKNAKADMLLITGDLVDLSNRVLPELAVYLRKLEKHFAYGMYMVPGNHDYFDDGQRFKSFLKSKAGFNLLINERRTISRGRGRLDLIGLDYAWPYRGSYGKRARLTQAGYQKAIQGRNPEHQSLVLSHHPADFDWLRKEPVDLVLSGHTHGGQVSLGQDRVSPLTPFSLVYKYYRGLYTQNESQLYVSRGLGHSIPLRIGTPPEITVLELH